MQKVTIALNSVDSVSTATDLMKNFGGCQNPSVAAEDTSLGVIGDVDENRIEGLRNAIDAINEQDHGLLLTLVM